MSVTVEISDARVVIISASGRRVEIGKPEDSEDTPTAPLPHLTVEEEKYGQGLCLLPAGWEDLDGDERWFHHLSAELRQLWVTFSREQRMSIAYTVSEMSDDLLNHSVESCR